MNIEIVDQIETFKAIRENWDNIYHQDSQAQFFISWDWISIAIEWLSQHQIPWLILAAKSSSNAAGYVGFLPLAIETEKNEEKGFFFNKLSLLGNTDGEHSGCLSLPEYETEAVSTFVNYLQQQDFWSVLSMSNVSRANKRIDRLLRGFDSASFKTQKSGSDSYQNPLDEIDNRIAPYLTLPDSWSEYLQGSLSSNTRQKVRRFLRKVENSAEFRITTVNAENIEQHIQVITELWRASWESRKGVEKCNKIVQHMTTELYQCFEHGCLHLPVLWQGDKPLATIANLVDFDKKTVLFLVGGRDETFRKFPPGFVLHACAIRDAIAQGFKTYDFLQGNEAYKYSFGARERYIQTTIIERQDGQPQIRKLNAKTLPVLLRMSQFCHNTNDLDLAATGYRQVLEIEPENTPALYGLYAIAQRRGQGQDAEDLLNRVLEIEPDNIKAWFGLGTLHQISERLSLAEKAYRQALSYQPEPNIAMAIYHNLGYALQQQGKLDEAISYYQKARELRPDSIEAEVLWANALNMQGKLSPEQQLHYAAINNELGHKRRQANDFSVATEYYQQAVALNPNFAQPHYHLGRLHQLAENLEKAIFHYQTTLKIQPDYLPAELAIAKIRYAQGELSAEQQLNYSLLNNNVGNQYLQAGDLQIAIEHYRQAIELNPNLAEAYYDLALSLHKQNPNNLAESIACYQKALTLKPDFELANVELAKILHTQGKLNPEQQIKYATISYNLGNRYMQTGNFRLAAEYYEFAVIINPQLTEARHSLRQAIERQEERSIKVSAAKS